MFHLTYITRTTSSGFESRDNKTFDTLEAAAAYIHGMWYDNFCEINDYPDCWDETDFGRPFPTRDEFNLEAIKKMLSDKYTLGNLFNPYSNYAALVPNELILKMTKD